MGTPPFCGLAVLVLLWWITALHDTEQKESGLAFREGTEFELAVGQTLFQHILNQENLLQ